MVVVNRSLDTRLTVDLWEECLIESELKYIILNF